ncbi:M50 family metallopeptidase [Haloimpatiens sp. FM7315]|uniref:M50 family metallopeptidase n=1 Tax=Haloimpatiens sp. FM7315 TaxID=3298609 RepID=UPI00370B605E
MIKFNKYFVWLFLLLIIIGFKGKIIISFSVVFCHELIHYLTARILGFSGFDIEILPIGTVLKLKDLDDAKPLEDIIISISGPLFNLLCALILYIFFIMNFHVNWTYYLFITNLSIGVFNLIPALPLDGGRILRDILNFRYYYKKSNIIAINVSICIAFIILFLYLVLFFSNNNIYNINLGLIGIFILSCALRERERISYLIMGDIIKKKFKFLRKRYIENRSMSVYYKENLLFLMNLIDVNRYNIFYVLDENMKIISVIHEGEIIEALKQCGNITIEEYIELK